MKRKGEQRRLNLSSSPITFGHRRIIKRLTSAADATKTGEIAAPLAHHWSTLVGSASPLPSIGCEPATLMQLKNANGPNMVRD